MRTNPGRPNPAQSDGGATIQNLTSEAGQPPDVEWCAERAAHALRWLAMRYPECSGSEALHPLQEAAHEAAVSGTRDDYLEALREYMRTGRDVALGVRRRAA